MDAGKLRNEQRVIGEVVDLHDMPPCLPNVVRASGSSCAMGRF
jgi:hypothetical protein